VGVEDEKGYRGWKYKEEMKTDQGKKSLMMEGNKKQD
jgi:hypothetical protein